MAQKLVYTSSPKGLQPGAYGFCVVAATRGLHDRVASFLASTSGYRRVFSPESGQANLNPVSHTHMLVDNLGQTFRILSRVADAGLDYTNRTNKIASFLLPDRNELVPAGPAALFDVPGLFYTSWNQEPTWFEPTQIPAAPEPASTLCSEWARVMGAPDWGAALAATVYSGAPVALVYEPGRNVDVLKMFQESIHLLPVNMRWNATFSTYFTQAPLGAQCQWKAVLVGSPEEATMRSNPRVVIFDLTRPGGAMPEVGLASPNGAQMLNLARGVAPVPVPTPTTVPGLPIANAAPQGAYGFLGSQTPPPFANENVEPPPFMGEPYALEGESQQSSSKGYDYESDRYGLSRNENKKKKFGDSPVVLLVIIAVLVILVLLLLGVLCLRSDKKTDDGSEQPPAASASKYNENVNIEAVDEEKDIDEESTGEGTSEASPIEETNEALTEKNPPEEVPKESPEEADQKAEPIEGEPLENDVISEPVEDASTTLEEDEWQKSVKTFIDGINNGILLSIEDFDDEDPTYNKYREKKGVVLFENTGENDYPFIKLIEHLRDAKADEITFVLEEKKNEACKIKPMPGGWHEDPVGVFTLTIPPFNGLYSSPTLIFRNKGKNANEYVAKLVISEDGSVAIAFEDDVIRDYFKKCISVQIKISIIGEDKEVLSTELFALQKIDEEDDEVDTGGDDRIVEIVDNDWKRLECQFDVPVSKMMVATEDEIPSNYSRQAIVLGPCKLETNGALKEQTLEMSLEAKPSNEKEQQLPFTITVDRELELAVTVNRQYSRNRDDNAYYVLFKLDLFRLVRPESWASIEKEYQDCYLVFDIRHYKDKSYKKIGTLKIPFKEYLGDTRTKR